MFNNDDYDKNESMTRNIQRAFTETADDAMPGHLQALLWQLQKAEIADEDDAGQRSD